MIDESLLLRTMRRILWLVATGSGGMGVAAVWGSFHNPRCSIDALITLSTAILITLAIPEPHEAARR